MDLTQTREFVFRNYRRRYRVTLSLTDRNVDEALEVYRFGVENALGIVQAIEARYGYRYRRMENFLRECMLWKEGEGWLHWRVLTKLYFDYWSKKEDMRVELSVYHLAPEFLIGEHDTGECESFFWDVISELRMDWIIYMAETGVFSVGDDVKFHETDYMLSCTQTADCDITVFRKGKIAYDTSLSYELANYQLYGVIVC